MCPMKPPIFLEAGISQDTQTGPAWILFLNILPLTKNLFDLKVSAILLQGVLTLFIKHTCVTINTAGKL